MLTIVFSSSPTILTESLILSAVCIYQLQSNVSGGLEGMVRSLLELVHYTTTCPSRLRRIRRAEGGRGGRDVAMQVWRVGALHGH
jgi:hypothetical protein